MILFKLLRSILIMLFLFLTMRCSDKDSKPIKPEDAKKGELLFNSTGCTKCHSVTGQSMYGPPLNFAFDREIVIFRKGKKISVKLDRRYIIRSIKNPDSEKLDGYQDKKMTLPSLSDEEINLIADYLIYINTKGMLAP